MRPPTTDASPATDARFHGFFDDAAVFPPGLAPLPQAVEEFIAYKQDPVAGAFVGPLVLPLDKIDEAVTLANGATLRISAVLSVDKLPEAKATMTRLAGEGSDSVIESVEVKVAADIMGSIDAAGAFHSENPDVQVFVELPSDAISDTALSALKSLGLALKFRTGGIEKHLFPTSAQLIDVLAAANRAGVPFKLTAGLHRAMRYTDSTTGFNHFGFLNIAAATAALRRGDGHDNAMKLLDSDNADLIGEHTGQDSDWRHSFLSFGTCSLTEPTETLGEIGQLSEKSVNAF